MVTGKYKVVVGVKLVAILLLCSYSKPLIAQNTVPSYSEGIEYTNDYQILKEFKTEVKTLTKDGVQLTPEEAKEEIKGVEGKRIHIDLKAPNQKVLTANEVYQRALKSVVLIGKPYRSRSGLSRFGTASGYVIDNSGIIVTNYHVVEGYANSPLKHIAIAARTNSGKIYLVSKILATSKEMDLAILQLETNGDKLIPIALGKPAVVGSTVYVLSNPHEMFNFFSKGIVSRNVKHKDHHGNILKYEMSITADYGVGSSGGPILDKYGNIAGTVASTYNIYSNPYRQKGLQMVIKSAIPVAGLKEMISY